MLPTYVREVIAPHYTEYELDLIDDFWSLYVDIRFSSSTAATFRYYANMVHSLLHSEPPQHYEPRKQRGDWKQGHPNRRGLYLRRIDANSAPEVCYYFGNEEWGGFYRTATGAMYWSKLRGKGSKYDHPFEYCATVKQ